MNERDEIRFQRNHLREEFGYQAEWRHEKAEQYPDDRRNAEAVAIFEKLAATVQDIDERKLLAYVEAFENRSEDWVRMLGEVGFHRWPETAEELIDEFIGG